MPFLFIFQKLSSSLQEAREAIESLSQNNKQLKEERKVLEKSVRDHSMENERLSSEVDRLTSRIAVLEMQSKLARDARAEEKDHFAEITKFKELVEELEGKNGSLSEEIEKLDKENKVLEFNLQDSAQALKSMFKERDLMFIHATVSFFS